MPLFSNSFLHYLCMATMVHLRVGKYRGYIQEKRITLIAGLCWSVKSSRKVRHSQFPSTTPTSNIGAGHESWHAETLLVTGLCHDNKHYLIIGRDDLLNNLNNSSNGSTYPRTDVPIWLPPLEFVNLPYKEPTAVHRPLSASGIKYLSIKHSTRKTHATKVCWTTPEEQLQLLCWLKVMFHTVDWSGNNLSWQKRRNCIKFSKEPSPVAWSTSLLFIYMISMIPTRHGLVLLEALNLMSSFIKALRKSYQGEFKHISMSEVHVIITKRYVVSATYMEHS